MCSAIRGYTTVHRNNDTPPCLHSCLHAPTHALAFAPRLDDAISITRNEDDFIERWVRGDDGNGHIKGLWDTWAGAPYHGILAPDEWVIASEFLRRNKTVS